MNSCARRMAASEQHWEFHTGIPSNLDDLNEIQENLDNLNKYSIPKSYNKAKEIQWEFRS